MRAVGDRAVDLAGAVDRVRGAALDPAAMDMARLDETGGISAGTSGDEEVSRNSRKATPHSCAARKFMKRR